MIEFKKITQDLIREYFKDFESDSDIYMDMSKFSEYRYDEEKVNAYFERISADTTRKAFIITEAGRPIGEICIKHINTAEKRGELSVHLQNDRCKNKGYGTLAERLMLQYAFGDLGLETVFADAVLKNKRSQHVLEKVGFEFIKEEGIFRYYKISKERFEMLESLRNIDIRVKTNRLTIRKTAADDWRDIREIWIDFSKSPYAQYDVPHSTNEEDVKQRIARWAQANNNVEHQFFSILLGEKVIGYAAFNARENGYEIGYAFNSAYHGNGYAKESLSALIKQFKEHGVRTFFAGTAINNTPSVHLLSALGFKKVGAEKVSFYKDENGEPIFFDGGIFELKF